MQVVKIKGEIDAEGHLHLDLPEQLPAGPVELILILGSAPEGGDGKYDFTDLAARYRVLAVPKTIINDGGFIEGSLPEEFFLEEVLKIAQPDS